MAIQPFMWQGGQAISTPEAAQRQRAIAEALMAQAQTPAQNWAEGLADVTGALSGSLINNRVSQAEEQGRIGAAEALAGLSPQSGFGDIATALSNPWLSGPQSTVAAALLQQNLQNADPLRQMQIEEARINLERLKTPQPSYINVGDGTLFNETTGEFLQAPGFGAAQAPDLVELFDETTGLPYKAQWNPATGGFERVGGVKAPTGGLTVTTDPETGLTTVTQGGTGKFETTAQGEFGKMFADLQSQGVSAVSGLDTLAAMEQQMADPNFYSGFGADQLLAARQAAAAMGINPEGVTSMETFNSLSKQAALASMGGSLGSGFSNADRSFVEQQVASLQSTPEGNRQLINLQRKILQRKIDIAVLANQYREQNGKLDGGFTEALKQYAEQNPLFATEATQGGGSEVDSILEKYGI